MAHWVSISEMVSLGYGSRGTIYQHIAEGDFRCGNPGGGKWIIDLESYEAWLERNTVRKRKRRIYRRTRKESIR